MEEFDLSGFELVETPEECVLNRPISLTVKGSPDFLEMKVMIPQGTIAQYGNLKPDYITVFFEEVEVNVTQEQFDQMMKALPRHPAGLYYRTLDDAFSMEDEPFWICDLESGAFLDTSAFPEVVNNLYSCIDISEAYCRDRYGKSWIILTREE